MYQRTAIFLVFAVFVLAQSEAAEMSGQFKDPCYPGKCVYDGLVLNSGQTGTTKSCERVFCGDDSFATVQSCGLVLLPPNMKFGKQTAPNAQYPECCHREVLDSSGRVV